LTGDPAIEKEETVSESPEGSSKHGEHHSHLAEEFVGEPSSALGERHLKFPDVIAQSFGFMGPVFSVAFLMPLIVGAGFSGKGAGVATPIAVLIAALGTASIAWMISRYARRISAAGALYEYVTRAAGPRAGFVAGWAYYGAAILAFAAGTIFIVGGTLSEFLGERLDVHISWWVLGIGITVLAWAVVTRGVRIATRAQLALAGVSALVVLGFSLWVIIKGGAHGNSLAPFNPAESSLEGIFFGVLYGVALFIGFETAANLSEETENPGKSIPRALYVSIGLGALYFVICAYSQAIGFGLDAGSWAASGAPLLVLGSDPKFGSTTMSDILTVIVIIDGLAVTIGTWVATSHGLFALARDRRLPRMLAGTHPKYGTPRAAATFLAVFTVGLILIMRLSDGILSRATAEPGVLQPQYYPFWAWIASIGPFLFVFVYLMISVSGMRDLWNSEQRPKLVIAGVAGTLLCLAAMFGTVYKAPSPFNTVPYWAAGWILAGILIAVLHRGKAQLDPATTPVDMSAAGAVETP
jgi:amino acid transporter